MKHSIKKQFAFIFIMILSGIVLLSMIANLLFFKQFYIQNKVKSINNAYKIINNASIDNKLMDPDFHEELLVLCEASDLSVVILDNSGNIITTVKIDEPNYLEMIKEPSFSFENDGKKRPSVEIIKDPIMNYKYLEMKGHLENNESYIIRCAIISVDDNVAVTNRFIFYVALFMILVGIVLIIIFTDRITKPIVRLTEISSKMANLDFETKYDSEGNNEVDVLGENMNEMSDKLEKTISELKSANNELLRDIERKNRNEEMRKEFLANVSHELKTPIALIQSYTEGLKDGIIEDEESRQYYLDVIIDEAGRMNNIVKEIMSLSELEYGNNPIEIERFDIVEMINNKIASAIYLFDMNEVEFIFDNKDDSIFVWADEPKTEDVFMNYLSNAFHYCEGEKKIKVFLEKKDDDIIRINVFNTGRQLNEEEQKRVWDKFYKADAARSRDYGGTGIGLSVVKAIMSSLKMAYGCYNSDDGVTFYFELPTK
ncbi:MAG: HAMP domain-containing protein [Lachnospiraceae bacterium]|nr:HAMP domain-containing protein [Lachnospiraceae bacterium]